MSTSSSSSFTAGPGSGAGEFPTIRTPGPALNPKDYIEKGTGWTLGLAYTATGLGLLVGAVATFGVILIPLLLSPVIRYFTHKRMMALVHGSGLRVSPGQLPQIHECVRDFAARLGMERTPETYIVEDSVMNAAAVRFGNRDVVLLTDELIHGALVSGNPHSLAFVIGHELGHIALKHHGSLRGTLRLMLRKLSRLDEYTVDRIGMMLVGKRSAAFHGILMLTVGPHLMSYVNLDEVRRQIEEVRGDKLSVKAEKQLTHPLLMHRLERIIRREDGKA